MSINVNVYVEKGIPARQIAAYLNDFCFGHLKECPADICESRFEETSVGLLIQVLSPHGMEPDAGIPFSRYEAYIGIWASNAVKANPQTQDLMCSLALFYAAGLCDALHAEAMVVWETQRVIKVFSPSPPD